MSKRPRRPAGGRRLQETAPAGPPARWYPAVIAVATFIVYADAFANAFVWDDVHLIVDNPTIKRWSHVFTLWTSDLFPHLGSRYYRPLQTLTYLVDYQLWGLAPIGYHLTSTLLHAAVAVLLYRLVAVLADSPRAGLIAALLFAVHPVHTEAVTYISGRSDPLSALFMLVALGAFVEGRRTRWSWWRAGSLAAFAAALFAREAAMVLPLLVILVDLTLARRDGEPLRGSWRERVVVRYLPYVVVLALYAWIRVAVVGGAAVTTPLAQVPLNLRLATMLEVVVRYVTLLLVPIDQHMERTVAPAASWLDGAVLAAALAVGAGVALAVVARRRAWPVSFGVAWFLIALLPVANIVPLATFMAEHWLYVPSMGLFLAAGWAVDRAMTREWRKPAAAIAGIALVAYGALTARRNLDWKDGVTLYEATLRQAPASARVHSNLGEAYQRLGQLDRAEAAYRQALALDPRSSAPHNNLGNIYRVTRRPDQAAAEFRRAIALSPADAAAHNNLGLALLDLGRPEEARAAFEASLRANPTYSAAHSNLGNYHFRRGQLTAAAEAYRAAIRLDPGFAQAHNNLGSVYFNLGQLEQAEREYRRALALDPKLEEVRRNLEVVVKARATAPSSRRIPER